MHKKSAKRHHFKIQNLRGITLNFWHNGGHPNDVVHSVITNPKYFSKKIT